MKTTKRILALALICASFISLFSCTADNPSVKTKTFWGYFDTVGTLYDYTGSSKKAFSRVADRIEEELAEYHRLYDIYNEYDGIVNIATLNRTAGEGPQKVDKKIIDMLLFAKEMYTFTDGAVNVAMGSVLKIWHDYREAGVAIPDMSELVAANAHTDINSIIIDAENLTVEITDKDTRLDVGAIAKGYAVEMLAQKLWAMGGGYVLDIGGNLRVVGTKKDGSGWVSGIRNPDTYAQNPYVYTLTLKENDALVTSGSYERSYTVGGVRYHHIINGETLMPENYYLSVSVKSTSSALSDALSTAIFNMPYDEAVAFIEGVSGIFVILVLPNGEVVTVEGGLGC